MLPLCSGAILQAFGHVNRPLISLTVGGIIKCVLNAVLVGFEAVNIAGAPIATCVCYVVMIGMNVFFLRKYLAGCGAILWNTVKTAAAALLMGGFAYGAYAVLSGALGVKMGGMVSIMGAVVVYAVLVIVLKVVTVKELKSMVRR